MTAASISIARLLSVVKWIVFSSIALIGLLAGYYWLNYTDEKITQGQGYGFSIGQTREETFSAAKLNFQGNRIYYLNPLLDGSWGPHSILTFSIADYQALKGRDMWRFYFNEGDYRDFIRLRFDKAGRLMEIYRHRQAFELP